MTDIRIISIVRKQVSLPTTWIRVLYPFQTDTWITILAFFILVPTTLKIITPEKQRLGAEIMLAVFAPLTDQWHEVRLPSYTRAIINCWGLLCFSLTILYGGEVFSSIAVILPPLQPKTLMDLCLTKPQIMSRSSYTSGSKITADLQALIEVISETNRGKDAETNCMIYIAKELNRTFCARPDQLLPSSTNNPLVCKNQRGNPSYEQPVAFLEDDYYGLDVELIYRRSSRFWWTNVQPLNHIQEIMPVLTIANYLSKLLDLFMTGWASGGLTDHILKLQRRERIVEYSQRSNSTMEDNSVFEPMELKVLLAIRNIFIVLIGVVFSIFALENLETLKLVHLQVRLVLRNVLQHWKRFERRAKVRNLTKLDPTWHSFRRNGFNFSGLLCDMYIILEYVLVSANWH